MVYRPCFRTPPDFLSNTLPWLEGLRPGFHGFRVPSLINVILAFLFRQFSSQQGGLFYLQHNSSQLTHSLTHSLPHTHSLSSTHSPTHHLDHVHHAGRAPPRPGSSNQTRTMLQTSGLFGQRYPYGALFRVRYRAGHFGLQEVLPGRTNGVLLRLALHFPLRTCVSPSPSQCCEVQTRARNSLQLTCCICIVLCMYYVFRMLL